MTNIDQFESVFKAADKPRFLLEPVHIRSILVVTTLDRSSGESFARRARDFLGESTEGGEPTSGLVCDDDFTEVRQLLRLVDEAKPDIICTYRNLKRPAHDYPYSLGVFVDVLTQATDVPIMLLPAPGPDPGDPGRGFGSRQRVMAITDHLTGDHHLVSFAARLTRSGGRLSLSHVEDQAIFERYIEAISKIPTIDTDSARESLREQLLKEPHDFIESCREVLQESSARIEVEEVVTVGHSLMDYKRIVDEHEIELLVMNTKNEDQLAMHGLAYPLAVELRNTPMLLL